MNQQIKENQIQKSSRLAKYKLYAPTKRKLITKFQINILKIITSATI